MRRGWLWIGGGEVQILPDAKRDLRDSYGILLHSGEIKFGILKNFTREYACVAGDSFE
mgnify:CR=1 FL=1